MPAAAAPATSKRPRTSVINPGISRRIPAKRVSVPGPSARNDGKAALTRGDAHALDVAAAGMAQHQGAEPATSPNTSSTARQSRSPPLPRRTRPIRHDRQREHRGQHKHFAAFIGVLDGERRLAQAPQSFNVCSGKHNCAPSRRRALWIGSHAGLDRIGGPSAANAVRRASRPNRRHLSLTREA